MFLQLHLRERNISLLCRPIWYREQLPWDAAAAFSNSSCLFSLVQSSAITNPSQVLGIVEYYLNERKNLNNN